MSNNLTTVDDFLVCANCGKGEGCELKRCSGCKLDLYCSRDCQAAARPEHKKSCKVRASELKDEAKKKQLHQDDPDNIYQRWKWDEKFVGPEIHGKGLTAKFPVSMVRNDPESLNNLCSSICEKSVQIGMIMLSILSHNNMIFWPWGVLLNHLNLEKIGQGLITDDKKMWEGDHKMCCLVAYIHRATYQVIKFEYTYDFERLWNNKGDDLIVKITGDDDLMDVLDPMSPNEYNPFIPELKALSIDLLQLLGHPKEYAENWITKGNESERTSFSIVGLEAIRQVFYAAFTVMKEGMKSVKDRPGELPKHDEESLSSFRADLHTFIDGLKYDEIDLHSMTIGDLLAMGR